MDGPPAGDEAVEPARAPVAEPAENAIIAQQQNGANEPIGAIAPDDGPVMEAIPQMVTDLSIQTDLNRIFFQEGGEPREERPIRAAGGVEIQEVNSCQCFCNH